MKKQNNNGAKYVCQTPVYEATKLSVTMLYLRFPSFSNCDYRSLQEIEHHCRRVTACLIHHVLVWAVPGLIHQTITTVPYPAIIAGRHEQKLRYNHEHRDEHEDAQVEEE